MFVARSVSVRRSSVALRISILACVIMGIPIHTYAVVDPKDAEAVRALLVQVRQAQETMDTAHFFAVDDTSHYVPEQGLTNYVTSWEVWQKGKWRASERSAAIHIVQNNEKQSFLTRAILNDHQTISTLGSTRGESHIHASMSEMSARDKSEVLQYNNMDIRIQAYGDGRSLLTDFAIFEMPKFRWYVEQEKTAKGDPMFSLRVVPVEGGPLRSVWEIDPNHGYIVTRMVSYSDGVKYQERVTETVQSKSGVVIPSRTEDIRYLVEPTAVTLAGLRIPNANTPQSHSTITFDKVEIGVSIKDETFGVPFLRLQNGALLNVFQPNGSQQVMVVMDNMPLPEESALEVMRTMKAIEKLDAINGAPTTAPTAKAHAGNPVGAVLADTRNNSDGRKVALAVVGGMAIVSGALVLLWRSRRKGGLTK